MVGAGEGRESLADKVYVSNVFWSYDYCITFCRNKKSNDGWLLLESEANTFSVNDINLAFQYVFKIVSIIPQNLVGTGQVRDLEF